ncbi:MAG TPA: 5'/3'-nucleotidase SurE [Membranihabitans sp.]|nr:5'/3'-nucleotidase SurE [Membranihabitans sp.]
MSEKEKVILVTNDDGMFAPGLHALVKAMKGLGRIYIVSPDSPQSGKGHGITLRDPIRFNRVYTFDGVEAYECSGTPVDCVKWATKVLLKDQVIDLCVSGINHGANASINIIYSGTMSAAMEAAMEGIHSVGFSLLDFSFEADFSAAEAVARQISEYMLTLEERPLRPLLLNVNIPAVPQEQLKGIKVCRQANARWVEDFQEGVDPRGMKYYWMAGELINLDEGSDTDIYALDHGYVSVVPCQFDLTDYNALDKLKKSMDVQ